MTTPVRSGVAFRLALTAVLAVLAATLVLLAPADAAPRTCFWAVPDIGAGGTGTPAGIVIYRISVVDDGRDATGDVGLPEVTLVLPDGTRQPLTDACSAADVDTPPTLHAALRDAEGVTLDGATLPNATDPVTWEKFFNLVHAQSQRLDNTPLQPLQTLAPAEEPGGYLSNVHNAYVFTTTDRGHGPS